VSEEYLCSQTENKERGKDTTTKNNEIIKNNERVFLFF